MKNKVFIYLIVIVACFTLIGCSKNNSSKNNKNTDSSSSKLSNDIIKIDGIYLNNEYIDDNDESLKQVVLFYTMNAGEENIDISSNHFNLKINKNEYEAKNDVKTPDLTQYYYSNIIKKVYTGKSLKVAEIFNVSDGDLVSGKKITLIDSDDYAKGIKMTTDDIKKMDNLTSISLDVDKEYTTKRQAEEQEKLSAVDEATANKVKNDINGYYFDFPSYVGKTYTIYKLEFESPNEFKVTSTVAGNSISNNGTYTVTKGYIVLHYATGMEVNAPYSYKDGDIDVYSPFYSNGSDTTF